MNYLRQRKHVLAKYLKKDEPAAKYPPLKKSPVKELNFVVEEIVMKKLHHVFVKHKCGKDVQSKAPGSPPGNTLNPAIHPENIPIVKYGAK